MDNRTPESKIVHDFVAEVELPCSPFHGEQTPIEMKDNSETVIVKTPLAGKIVKNPGIGLK